MYKKRFTFCHVIFLFLDILHIVVCEEEVSSSLLPEEPEPPRIKEEQEELHQRPEDSVGSMLTLPAVASEVDDEEKSSNCFEIEVELGADTDVTDDSDDWPEGNEGQSVFNHTNVEHLDLKKEGLA